MVARVHFGKDWNELIILILQVVWEHILQAIYKICHLVTSLVRNEALSKRYNYFDLFGKLHYSFEHESVY